jgi:hypothetical protein
MDWNYKREEQERESAVIGKHRVVITDVEETVTGPNSKNPGADRTAIEVAAWLAPDEYEGGTWSQSLLRDRDQRTHDVARASVENSMPTPPMEAVTAVYDEDIPF